MFQKADSKLTPNQSGGTTCLVIESLVAREVGQHVVKDLELALREHLVEQLAHEDHDDELQSHK